MTRTILFFGLVAGLIAGGVGSLMAVTSMHLSPAIGMAIGYLTMLIALSTIFVAVKQGTVVGKLREVEGMRNSGLGVNVHDIIRKLAMGKASTASF